MDFPQAIYDHGGSLGIVAKLNESVYLLLANVARRRSARGRLN
jgi:hypothetical protein